MAHAFNHLAVQQGIRRPRPAERKRIRKHVEADAAGQQRTTADQLRNQLFGEDEEGALACLDCGHFDTEHPQAAATSFSRPWAKLSSLQRVPAGAQHATPGGG